MVSPCGDPQTASPGSPAPGENFELATAYIPALGFLIGRVRLRFKYGE
jgi:hypothetical protein